MSEYKQIKTRIWQDSWFLSLTTEEKLLWIFLLTNPYCHISGLYELPIPLIRGLLGSPDWEKILLKFVKDKKINYKDNWILIFNFKKHHSISDSANDNVVKSIKQHFEENKEILAKLSKPPRRPLEDPCQTLSEDELEDEDENIAEKISAKESSPTNPSPPDLPLKLTWNFDETLDKWINGKNRTFSLIGRYFKFKGIRFETKEQMQSAKQRHLRAAKLLLPFSDEQISHALEEIEKSPEILKIFTLETILKYLTK